jgi:riboflavin kinase/FMN adenylyltransferase
MKIYRNLGEFTSVANAVVTIGTFDGVHVGHRKILQRLKELAAEINGETVILTFFPHPRMILHPEDQSLRMLTTIDEKSKLLEEIGIDHLIITPFTRDFSNLSPEEYIREILAEKIGTRRIVIGYDHRFGKNRTGSIAELRELGPRYGFYVEQIPEQDIHEVAVSSSRIRTALAAGDIATANDFLGYPFHLHGRVIKGDQLGRQLGYPTANLMTDEPYKIVPADGIFAVTASLAACGDSGTLRGMAYIGNRPTVSGLQRNIEVNLFDFGDEIYGKYLRVNFHRFIRGDRQLSGLEALKVQLGKDKETVLRYFG